MINSFIANDFLEYGADDVGSVVDMTVARSKMEAEER
jgi:hypothetical protein